MADSTDVVRRVQASPAGALVMTLRTPRRRISPRTKRRYRAIRDFLRRALGSLSQPDIKINASIVNVTDLKHKILGIENQLNEVSKQCHGIVLESSSRRETESVITNEGKHDINTIPEQDELCSERKSKTKTKILYKTSDSHYRQSDESSDSFYTNHDHNKKAKSHNKMNFDSGDARFSKFNKVKKKKGKPDTPIRCESDSRNCKAESFTEDLSSPHSTTSYRSHVLPKHRRNFKSEHLHHHDTRDDNQEYIEPTLFNHPKKRNFKDHMKRNKSESPVRDYENKHSKKRDKHTEQELDQDFIADIIKRQYRPVTMFGKKESDISQFTAPVCRDQEYVIQENIIEDPELCSCCYDELDSKYVCRNDLSDLRSVCDTRLYSSKRKRHKHHKKHIDIYNDSALYDLVPVKETSSPKSRRKYVEEHLIPHAHYHREVPPSPRSLRPRLNLKTHYYPQFDDYGVQQIKQTKKRNFPTKPRNKHDYEESFESDISSEVFVQNEHFREKSKIKNPITVEKPIQMQQDIGTMSSVQQYPTFINEEFKAKLNDSSLNKSQETDSIEDKTDKALSEIKDILQNFLQEIKKESTTTSQSEKSDITPNGSEKPMKQFQNNNMNTSNKGVNNHNNSYVAQCSAPSPYISTFTNPCCYPIVPLYPMNCVQNGYMYPNSSYSCTTCANNTKGDHETQCSQHNEANAAVETSENKESNETRELIKEIYKYVAQNPIIMQKKDYVDKSPRKEVTQKIILTSRSAGSSKVTKHDAMVGTPRMKCSKSCEAIGSRMVTETEYTKTNCSYSDTVLENLSVEATATQSISDTVLSVESMGTKTKVNKVTKVLRSLGIFKKKKKDVIEELSESESAEDINTGKDAMKSHPYGQNVVNYMIHGQEYYNQPPMPFQHPLYQPGVPDPNYGYGYDPRTSGYSNTMPPPVNEIYNPHNLQQQIIHDQVSRYPYPSAHASYPSTCDPQYNPMQAQVPLCLKEIEVKSIGTQSERKMSFFKKFSKKVQPPVKPGMQDEGIQSNLPQAAKSKPGFLQEMKAKAAAIQNNPDPFKFSFNTRNDLNTNDNKMRKAMLKKLFYKRNPFSPRNLVIRTLMGKDRSSFGEPPTLYKPRMFF